MSLEHKSRQPSLPTFSKAAVLHAFGQPVSIEEVRVPEEIEPGALLVKVRACSVCGTDLHLSRGQIALEVDLPIILGHEMVGEIVAFGPGSDADSLGTPLRLGDRISWTHAFCGQCFHCVVDRKPALCTHRRLYMYSSMRKHPYLMGGFSEYCYVLPKSGRVRIPDAVSFELASMSSCAFRSVMNAFDQCGRVDHQDTVVIQGAGPLGLLATGVAHVLGARRVITIGAPDDRLQLARDFGADETISIETMPEHRERYQRVLELTGGRGADIVFEFSGYPPAFAEGLDIVRKGGRFVVVGQVGREEVSITPSLITNKNLNILGSFAADVSHYAKALNFISEHQHRLPFDRMLTGRYPLDAVNEVLERTAARQEIKPIIYPW